jgi:SAM-dependent methyltransferase
MKPEKDAYGKLLYAHFRDRNIPEVVERDDNYVEAGVGFINVYFSSFKDWPSIEKRASRFIKGRVLDVGCGAGRVGLYLQKKGYKTVSIDNSPLAVKLCKVRGVKDARVMSIDELHKFKPKTFDTIVMFGNNFGLFGNYSKAKKLLKEMYRITSDNARIVADVNDPYKTKDPLHLAYHKLNRKRGRMPGQLKIRVRFEDCVGDWFEYLFVSKSEMKDILQGTGWKAKRFITKKERYAAIIEKVK